MINRYQNSNKKQNLQNSNQKASDNANNQKKSSNLYSLKPQRLSIPKDVSTFSIFKTLLREVNCNFPTMQKKIELTHILLKNRLNIILKMKDFIIRYRLSSNSFFVAIYIMDSLIAKRIQLPIDKIGLGALVLSVKFTEIDGKMPSMNKFVDFMNNSSFTLNDLIKIEIECLKKLNYVITMPNPIHFIQLFLVNGILFNTDVKGTNTVSSNIYTMPSQLLDYVMEENTNYFQFHPLSLACACVAQSREAYGIEKWNKILQEVFDITFDVFEREFYYVKEIYQKRSKDTVRVSSSTTNIFGSSKDIPKIASKNILYSTPSKKNILNESLEKEAHKTDIVDKIINSAEPNLLKKKGNYYKSKSLDLNMAQLEEIIKHHKPSLKESHLNPIKELNDSSTAEDSSVRNVTEFIPKSKIYSKIMNMKNNGITGRSFINLSTTFDKDLSKSFTQYKRLNTESTKNSEKTITTSNIKKELFNEIGTSYKPMTTFQNYQHCNTLNKTISNLNNSNNSANVSFTSKTKSIKTNSIPETTRNINNYKRGTCISFKTCTLSTNSSLSNYSIKDLAKLRSMKSTLNSSTISFPRKGIK